VKKYLLTLALALPLLMTAAASAQTIHMRVTVPFNFIVAGATLPAGEYEIQSVGAAENLLSIHNRNWSAGIVVFSNSSESLSSSSNTKLVFHRYGDRYFLSELWVRGQRSGHQVPPASREKEVAMDFPRDEVVLLIARCEPSCVVATRSRRFRAVFSGYFFCARPVSPSLTG
jgi:hypothetical protein